MALYHYPSFYMRSLRHIGYHGSIDSICDRRHHCSAANGRGVLELANDDAAGQKPAAVYDEMVTGTGQVRPHWQRLMGRLSPLDPAALEDRRDEAVQLLRQHGATYSIYGDPQ